MTTGQPQRRRPRRRFNPLKAARVILPVLLFVGMIVVMCSPRREKTESAPTPVIAGTEAPVVVVKSGTIAKSEAKAGKRPRDVYDLETTDSVSAHLGRLPEMPEPTRRIKVNYFGDMRRHFNDSNYLHWAEAERIGIRPLSDTRSHWQTGAPLVKVTTCPDYWIDSLVYSRPYLVPRAADMLHEIGRRFRDTLAVRGGGDYRVKVTSLLRTPKTVKKLRRRNRNAIDSSVHQLGTTFDISYAQFVAASPQPARSVDDLKGILGEVLKAMREEGKIYVKYERGQPCFHITARPG